MTPNALAIATLLGAATLMTVRMLRDRPWPLWLRVPCTLAFLLGLFFFEALSASVFFPLWLLCFAVPFSDIMAPRRA